MALFRFENLQYRVGDSDERLLTVSGQVDRGDVLAVAGPSGSGKTTLLRILAKLQGSISGEAFLEGKSWREFSLSAWRIQVHYVSQKPAFLPGTVLDNLRYPFSLAANRDKPFNEDLAVELSSRMLLSQEVLQRDANLISGGEAVRVSLLRSILLSPKVLLADEPTAALDERARESVLSLLKDWVKKESRALVLVSHLDDARAFPHYHQVSIGPQDPLHSEII